jgi:hypothetical protein
MGLWPFRPLFVSTIRLWAHMESAASAQPACFGPHGAHKASQMRQTAKIITAKLARSGLRPQHDGIAAALCAASAQATKKGGARMPHSRLLNAAAMALLATGSAVGAGAPVLPDAATLAQQRAEYEANAPKPITHLQPFRHAQTATAGDTQLRLISLNPYMNAWFLLEVRRPGARQAQSYHIENPAPTRWRLALTGGDRPALRIGAGDDVTECAPWGGEKPALDAARASGLAYAPICENRLFLRNLVTGSRTSREATAEFLRDNVWLGESIVGAIKDRFYRDAFMESGRLTDGGERGAAAPGPRAAHLSDRPLMTTAMGFDLVDAPRGGVAMGEWYAVQDAPGIYASALQPGRIAPAILDRRGETNALDAIERRADVYLVAFDLAQFDLGFETGTDHPRLDWSPRAQGPGRDNRLPGPDGVGSPAPLVPTGMVSPALSRHVAATFTAGFKRSHGAFKFGPLAQSEHAHHYGFVVQGVVLSKLRPELATLYVLDDGSIGMKTWTAEDDALLPRIRFARQNGVALIAPDPDTGASVPGPFVRQWGAGNWSGSAEAELRTLRAGACLQRNDGRQYLIYGYFSTATPSAMARTFQALGCDYAMLLDMNALEHTYLALYAPGAADSEPIPQHLVSGMSVVDPKRPGGGQTPRFIGFSDNRDFFYLLRKGAGE